MMIQRVKRIMNVEPEQEPLIYDLICNFTDAVNLYCGTETLPPQLEFVVVEATIARMNRIGSEGLKSEDIDVIGLTYIEDILDPYKPYMDAYKKQFNNKVRFL